MSNIIDLEAYKNCDDWPYFKKMFIDKYLYVKRNIEEIYGVAIFSDKDGLIFSIILESLLLENSPIEDTYGYTLFMRLKNILDDYFHLEKEHFFEALMKLQHGLISIRAYDKAKIVNNYLVLNGLVDPNDDKFINKRIPSLECCVENNDFMQYNLLSMFNEKEVIKVKRMLERGRK